MTQKHRSSAAAVILAFFADESLTKILILDIVRTITCLTKNIKNDGGFKKKLNFT